MGWNTTMIIMNDALDAIKNDPNFGKNVHAAVLKVVHGNDVDVVAGNHGNAATVIETHHADCTALIAVGGNYGTKLDEIWGYSHHSEEDQIKLLKAFADKLGYRISKIPSNKK